MAKPTLLVPVLVFGGIIVGTISIGAIALGAWSFPVEAQEPAPATTAAEPIVFSKHIAPIVFTKCSPCHRPDQAAPFSLLNYRDVKKRGRLIESVTSTRYMPPWHPTAGHGTFANDFSLEEAEIERIKTWVESGMPEGDPSHTPALPKFSDGWLLGEPDLVVEMPEAFEVPAGGPDIYRNFVVPLNLDEDQWVTAIEVRPSARSVLHHIIFGLDTDGRARELDGRDGKPGYDGMGGELAGNSLGTSTSGVGGWAVGGMARHLPLGLARKFPKGSDLILRSHFHPAGKAEKEKTQLALYFADEPPKRTLIGLQLPPVFGIAAGLDIPPGAKDFVLEDSFELPVDALGLTVGGHAHYLCESMQVTATKPDGYADSIFYIDDWDFDWQNRYHYESPVELPAGTRIDVRVVYDNSAANLDNPFDPPRRVRWGLQSTDEMGSVTLLMVAKDESDSRRLKRAVRQHRRQHMREGGRDAATLLTLSRVRMMDQDGDGQISKDELPSRLRRRFLLADQDGNGMLDSTELDFIADQFAPPTPERQVTTFPEIRLSDLNGRSRDVFQFGADEVLVYIFTTVDCPIANAYHPELQRLHRQFADKRIRFHMIHVDPDVTAEAARAHQREYGVVGTVLLDPDHELVTWAGATKTPEVVVVVPNRGVIYRGRIDDSFPALGKKRPAPTRRELEETLAALLKGQAPRRSQAPAVGCIIADLAKDPVDDPAKGQ